MLMHIVPMFTTKVSMQLATLCLQIIYHLRDRDWIVLATPWVAHVRQYTGLTSSSGYGPGLGHTSLKFQAMLLRSTRSRATPGSSQEVRQLEAQASKASTDRDLILGSILICFEQRQLFVHAAMSPCTRQHDTNLHLHIMNLFESL